MKLVCIKNQPSSGRNFRKPQGWDQCDLKNLLLTIMGGISENVNPIHTELLVLLSGIEKREHKGHYGHKNTETNMMGTT